MSMIVFGSAKGAPGVTSTVLALAAVWPADRRVIVVECDPDGGDLAAWYGLAAAPGVVSLAAQARQALSPSAVSVHVQRLPGGDVSGEAVEVLVAPVGTEQASAAVRALAAAGAADRFAGLDDADVLVDVGRLRPDTPAMAFVARAAITAVILRPEAGQVAHARSRVAAVGSSGRPVVVVVGDRPYDSAHVSAVLDAPVAGVIADDARGARALTGNGGGARALRRSLLLRSAATAADQLCRLLDRPYGWPAGRAETTAMRARS